jgi:hypothetical protein
MTDHIFDILGIISREDSYTDLIAYAFKHHFEFRKNLLALLQEKDHGIWELKVRPPVSITSLNGRKKDIPDLILFNKELNKILLIENKVFSGEGWKQTERYASNEFRESLKKYLEIEIEPDFKFFFLTLDETKPYSSSFQTISYLDISKSIPQTLGNSNLDILLKELRERIDEYYSWPLPNENDVILDYLKNIRRLVSSYRTFRIVTDSLFDPDLDFLKKCGITANRGSGYIPYCSWYKELWSSQENPEEKDNGKCYDIHFEFQWDTREDWENLTLYLHYHTNPCMTQKELKKEKSKDFIAKYEKARDDFFNFVKENAPQDWNIKKTYLRIAHHSFNKNVKFEELKRKVNELVNSMTPIIDNHLRHYNTALA